VLISDLRNPFYADLATGIEQVLRAEGHHMVLINDNGEPDEEMQAAETLVAMQVPGVILTPATAECPRMLRSNGVHVVCADRDVKGSGSPDVVASDNQAGAKELVAHLIGLGHRRIGLLIDETMWATGAGRLAGYRSAHDDAGIPVDPDLIVHTSFDAEDAAKKTAELLDTTELTALFCANNVLAQGALSVLQHRRVRIPRQLSLASYDDVPWMSLVHPAMTTVDQHSVEMGRTCARLVLARIRDELPARRRIVRVPPQLVLRGSTAPPRWLHATKSGVEVTAGRDRTRSALTGSGRRTYRAALATMSSSSHAGEENTGARHAGHETGPGSRRRRYEAGGRRGPPGWGHRLLPAGPDPGGRGPGQDRRTHIATG
jgi:LacI family transcriptional regulator